MIDRDFGSKPTSEQYSLGQIFAATFLPAILVLLTKGVWGIAGDSLGNTASIGARLSEAGILIACMILIGRKFSSRSISSASDKSLILYRARRPLWMLIAGFVVATAWAIGFRDYVSVHPLDATARWLSERLGFWPPEWLDRLQFYYPIDEQESKAVQLAQLFGLLVAFVAASAAQTLYFRGFLLPRMDRLGWWAVLLNTALFAAFHMSSPEFWLHFFVWTFMWGAVSYWSRNVWPAVISHMVFNGYSWVLMMGDVISSG